MIYMKTRYKPSLFTGMILINYKDGNGITVGALYSVNSKILTAFFQVFSKQEIVFARTSPQHKLEIGTSRLNYIYNA